MSITSSFPDFYTPVYADGVLSDKPSAIANDEFHARYTMALNGTSAKKYYRAEFGYTSKGITRSKTCGAGILTP